MSTSYPDYDHIWPTMHSSVPVHAHASSWQPFPSLCLHPAGCSSVCTNEYHRSGSTQPFFKPSGLPHSYILPTPAGYDNASKTKQYDAEAIQYTSYLVYPLVACYAVYALIYKTHKSWYSWLLSSLVGAVYSFGFIMMVPQASKLCRQTLTQCRLL